MLWLKQYFPLLRTFVLAINRQCREDRIAVSAGHLAYVSLLSLVPMIMMFFAIMSAFPAFTKVRHELESFVFVNFVPHAGDVVQKYVSEFVGNASQMGAVGIFFLVAVALLLISSIDKTLNHLWRTQIRRQAVFTFAIYWTVLTLGPLLVGTSVAMTSYLVGLKAFADTYTPGLTGFIFSLTPFLISAGGFFIVYTVVPNKRVSAKHAASGALFAAILFELSKKLFAIYVSSFPSYQVIYGALAAIPILFVWVYLSWILVLLGAVFVVQLEQLWPAEDEDTLPSTGHHQMPKSLSLSIDNSAEQAQEQKTGTQ